jgi:pSer/pThr/pTyr-binding forkhead associated (FHA) protein
MALLVLLHEGLTINKIPIEKEEMTIGRLSDSDIYLDDKMVSQAHAKIVKETRADDKGVQDHYVVDLDSTNHTFVNGEKITRTKLVHDDTIRIGKHIFKFVDETAVGEDKTTKLHKSWIPGVYYTKE